ncbi:hypothetical protein HDU76_012994 [Blyttiomyces sp. JEL0837]|nr:hypothetical protein HDU76_012994 [Blyttiomyces sp. JEL0837]
MKGGYQLVPDSENVKDVVLLHQQQEDQDDQPCPCQQWKDMSNSQKAWSLFRMVMTAAFMGFVAATLVMGALITVPGAKDWLRVNRIQAMLVTGTASGYCPPRPAYTHPFLTVRPRLFQILDKAIDDDVAIILPTAERPIRAESDAEYAFWKQSPNVMYIMGPYTVSGGVIVLTKSKTTTTSSSDETELAPLFNIDVYLPEQSEREAIFTGAFPSAETLAARHKVQGVYNVSSLPDRLQGTKKILTTAPVTDLFRSLGAGVAKELKESGATIQYSLEAQQAFVKARFVKNAEELELLTYASQLAGWVHKQLERSIYYSWTVSENDLYAQFAYLSNMCRAPVLSYPSIVGAAEHGAILHYRTGEDVLAGGYDSIRRPSFILIDAAPEYFGYTSDLTRTYARNRVMTPNMKIVHDMVARVQHKFMHEYYHEGASWGDINAQFVVDITKELLDNGFLVGELDVLLKNGMFGVFMPHGLGHPVGLEVHDPTPLNTVMTSNELTTLNLPDPTASTALPFAWSKSSNEYTSAIANYTVFRGHITTVEPGIYFIPGLLESVKRDPVKSKFVNWDKSELGVFVEIGGVRIEDVVMIDVDGKKRIITKGCSWGRK